MSIRHSGWLPAYHGGWAMILIPSLAGLAHSDFTFITALTFMAWLCGYFFFYAASIFVRSHFNKRYIAPTLTYGSIVVSTGLCAVVANPFLLWWICLLVPLLAFVAWQTYRRKDRAFSTGTAEVAAASLGFPIVWYAHMHESFWAIPSHIWYPTLWIFLYLLGTIFYVKTNIREKKSRSFFITSLSFHIIVFALSIVYMLLLFYLGPIIQCIAWLLATGRAWFVPRMQKHGKHIKVSTIGIGEVVLSLIFFTAFVLM